MRHQPFVNQVIRASAGSGKTHRLTNRYLGLLTADVEPDLILATTFTRKAASEILDRVLARLAEAAGAAEASRQLAAELDLKKNAQQDFASLLRRVLGKLHRVRIGTLDSFYIALAGSFSLELGLPTGWSIAEDVDDKALQEEALERLLEREQADVLIALYQRLTAGETKRGARAELLAIVTNLYGIHQETEANVWTKIVAPRPLRSAELNDLFGRIETFDVSKISRMPKARSEDLDRARMGDWENLVAKGLCGKVISGENAYYSKPIPDELIALYRQLVEHARGILLQPVAEQTGATREFLDDFHDELWALKQRSGQLRFEEVTRALGDGLRGQALSANALAFRLDGAIEHLLLDEFQDTSLAQWRVLEPIAQRITRSSVLPSQSFFCVGDVKQAIYSWRGGMAEILDTLDNSLGPLENIPLDKSQRSAQPIIDIVNDVFSRVGHCLPDATNCHEGLATWQARFTKHTTAKTAYSGYACLHTGPAQQEGDGVDQQRAQHCKFVAEKIRDLVQQAPGHSLGVLCRKNEGVARMIYELRLAGVQASEEGSSLLTDSAAVELLLSLFTLADHPCDSIASFHVHHSPFKDKLQQFSNSNALARRLRRELLRDGYGPFTHAWAKILVPACDERELGRLQQLIDLAYAYQPRSTLRADDFVAWVREQRKPSPLAARVRVMTIHAAKGLQFEIVVLPELDAGLLGKVPAFVVHRDQKSLDVDFVCRYAKEAVLNLLTEENGRAFAQDRRRRVEESLSLLYVAMTRAIHALYLYVPGPRRKSNRKDAWYNLLLQTLVPGAPWAECALLVKRGDANWFQNIEEKPMAETLSGRDGPTRITFRPAETSRRRGLEHIAPSRREGDGRIILDRLFDPPEGKGKAAGTLYHAWFATIQWLEDGPPTDATLHAAAAKLRADLPLEIWRDLDRLMATFREWLQNPAISSILRRSAYADPQQPGFPTALAPFWTNTIMPRVERERRFLVPDGPQLWSGSLDRVVWFMEGDKIVAADVLDFKTDAIAPGDALALAERVEHYRPQLKSYRLAVGRLGRVREKCIALRLIFTIAGCAASLD